MSQLKIKDGNNWINIPASGVGVPSGVSSGQFLKKSSSTDYATEWALTPTVELTYMGDIKASTTVNITEDGLYLLLATANAASGSVNPYFSISLNGTQIGEASGSTSGNVTTFKVLNLSAGDTLVVTAERYISNYGKYGIDAIVVLKLA